MHEEISHQELGLAAPEAEPAIEELLVELMAEYPGVGGDFRIEGDEIRYSQQGIAFAITADRKFFAITTTGDAIDWSARRLVKEDVFRGMVSPN